MSRLWLAAALALGCSGDDGGGSEGLETESGMSDGTEATSAGSSAGSSTGEEPTTGDATTGDATTGGPTTSGQTTSGAETSSSDSEGDDPDVVPDFSLVDVNPSSSSLGEEHSPRDYLDEVSAWYFIHAT